MRNEKLTGRWRYRLGFEGAWFWKTPVQVLQVETTWGDGPDDYHGMPTYLRGTGWRDARVEDLLDLHLENKDANS